MQPMLSELMVERTDPERRRSAHRCTGTMVQGPGEPRVRQSPSHTPAKNTAFSSCGASYTASIFSGSSGQNVATSRGPMGLFRGVTVRQMNLGGGGHRKPHLRSLCRCSHRCLPKPTQKLSSDDALRGGDKVKGTLEKD